jgi:hypothetical protein
MGRVRASFLHLITLTGLRSSVQIILLRDPLNFTGSTKTITYDYDYTLIVNYL